jgi:hypothetical protein
MKYPSIYLLCVAIATLCFSGDGLWSGPPRVQREAVRPVDQHDPSKDKPSTAELLRVYNETSRLLTAVRCDDVVMTGRYGRTAWVAVGVLVYQSPRHFRLCAKVLGQPVLDIGSNDRECWYWCSCSRPSHVYHGSWKDYERGKIAIPFGLRPEILLPLLGMDTYDVRKAYQARKNGQSFELIETVRLPDREGKVQKVTVFGRGVVGTDKLQVLGYALRDERGKEICSATISQTQSNPTTGVVLQRRIKLSCPAEQSEISVRLDEVRVVTLEKSAATRCFTRLKGDKWSPGYDLGKRALDPVPKDGSSSR